MRPARIAALAAALLATAPAAAFAHAEVSPKASVSKQLQLYSLAVPTEKDNATTVKIVLTLPKGFAIDSFAPSPGWHRLLQQSSSGDSAVIQRVTWTGGHVPTDEDSLFQFLAQADSAGVYTFTVQQTYSDGSIVNWSGPESSDSPAPTIEVKSSLGGGGGRGGVSALTIVALIIGVLGLLAGGLALAGGRGGDGGQSRRPLA